jgi:hypothetical protein
MSSGFIFGTDPLKFTTPVTVPAVAASTEIVAGLAAEDGSEAGCDLLHPARAMNMTRNRNPKPLKHGGNEEAEELRFKIKNLRFLCVSAFCRECEADFVGCMHSFLLRRLCA